MEAISETTILRKRRFPWLGAFCCATALALLVTYFAMPHLTRTWTMPHRLMAGSVVVSIGLLGVKQVLDQQLQARGRRRRLPTFNRNRVIIPREGLTYLGIMIVLFVGSLLGHQNLLMLVFSMMAGPFVLNGWVTFTALQGSAITRRTPPRAMVGEPFSVEVVFENKRPWLSAWMMLLRDRIRSGSDEEELEASVLFTRVGPKSSQLGHYQLRLGKRGRYEFGPVLVSSRYPLGLIERGLLFLNPGSILIHPRVGCLNPTWKRELMGATELVHQSRSKAGVFNDDFHHLREYRIGDNPRAIHWRSSARRNELIVRQYHQNREHNLSLVVDLHQSHPQDAAEKQLVELALSLVATFCVEHVRDSRESLLRLAIVGATEFVWEGAASPASLETILDHLAVVEAGLATSTTAQLQDALRQATASTRVVLMTTRATGRHSDGDGAQDSSFLAGGRAQVIHVSPAILDSILFFDAPDVARSSN